MSSYSSVLEVSNVSKRFGGIQALENVHLTVAPQKIRALVGANGSGKSTLVKILAGYHRPEQGVARIDGIEVPLEDERRLREIWRIGAVHQDLALIDELTVAENFLLPYLAETDSMHLKWSKLRSVVEPYLVRFGVRVSPRSKVADAPRVERALLALARAVRILETPASAHAGSPVDLQRPHASSTLILDEITAFLSVEEVAMLRTAVRSIADAGFNVLFVSHDLDEIVTFADDLTVLRDGKVVSTCAVEEINKASLFTLIAGHPPRSATAGSTAAGGERPRQLSGSLVVTGLNAEDGELGPVDLTVEAGEVVGLTGLIGSGFEHVPYSLFGAGKTQSGSISLGGRSASLSKMRPSDAIATGIALVPGDRARQGLWMDLSIGENLAPTNGSITERPLALSWRNLWSKSQETVELYRVKTAGVRSRVTELSGGNAQRVLLAKWLAATPQLLLLHEPAQGVDVGARVQIAELIRKRAETGLAVLCASSDHEFLGQVCDRVLVFSGGVIRAELQPEQPGQLVSKEQILWACQSKENEMVGRSLPGVAL